MNSTGEIEISEEEYLIREPEAEYKSEYYDGRMRAMSGASLAHNRITVNLAVTLRQSLKGKPCEVFLSDMRLRVASAGVFGYPDVTVVYGEARFDQKDTYALVNPTVIFEVLSPSTDSFDRGKKFEVYQRLASLRAYVLVRQDAVGVTAWNLSDGKWRATELTSLDAELDLPEAGCRVSLREVYERVF